MDLLTSHPGASAAVQGFLLRNGGLLPPALQDKLAEALTTDSPVRMAWGGAECLYANLGSITDPGAKAAAQTLAGQLARWCADNDFHDMGKTGRGLQIWRGLSRDLGETAPEGTAWPDPADDPAALAEWATS